MRSKILYILVFCLFAGTATNLDAQNVAINSSGATPNASAVLDLSGNTGGGFLLPYLTTAQMNTLAATAANSLLIYNSDINCIEGFFSSNSTWQPLYCPCTGPPSTPTAPTGTTSLCVSTSATYSVTPVNGSSYTWTLSGGGTFSVSGTTTQTGQASSATVNWGAAGGTYSITVTSTNGCGTSASSPALAVTVNGTPAAPTITSGPTSICISSSGNSYTASSAGATSYTWTVPAAVGTIASGQGTATILVNANASTGGPGNITCTATGPCGTSGSSAGYAVTVITTPTVAAIGGGAATVGISSTTPAFTDATAGGTWSITNGTGSATITAGGVATGVTAGTVTVNYAVTNACGTTTVTTSLTVLACGTISVDNTVVSAANTKTVTITTNHANEIVLVMANGFSTACHLYTGTCSVSGGSASAVTTIVNTYGYWSGGCYVTNAAIFGFVAATAATYTITLTETGDDWGYNNSAVAFYGFCNTATIAGNTLLGTTGIDGPTGSPSQVSTISSSITPTVANSYVVANYYSETYYGVTGAVSWTSPSNNILGTDNDGATVDGSIDGYAQGAAGALTFTVKDQDAGSANIYAALVETVDVHN